MKHASHAPGVRIGHYPGREYLPNSYNRIHMKKYSSLKPQELKIVYLVCKKGTSRQRSGKGVIRKRFPLQKPRWEKTKLTIRYFYHEKKVQVGKDQEKAQSEKDSHSKNQGGKKPN